MRFIKVTSYEVNEQKRLVGMSTDQYLAADRIVSLRRLRNSVGMDITEIVLDCLAGREEIYTIEAPGSILNKIRAALNGGG